MMINDFVEKIEDSCRLAQTCIDLHRLAKTYMTIGKTGTVIFDVEMVEVGLWVNSIGFLGDTLLTLCIVHKAVSASNRRTAGAESRAASVSDRGGDRVHHPQDSAHSLPHPGPFLAVRTPSRDPREF